MASRSRVPVLRKRKGGAMVIKRKSDQHPAPAEANGTKTKTKKKKKQIIVVRDKDGKKRDLKVVTMGPVVKKKKKKKDNNNNGDDDNGNKKKKEVKKKKEKAGAGGEEQKKSQQAAAAAQMVARAQQQVAAAVSASPRPQQQPPASSSSSSKGGVPVLRLPAHAKARVRNSVPRGTVVFVRNLDPRVTARDLVLHVFKDEEVIHATVHHDEKGQSLGAADLVFGTRAEAMDVVAKYAGTELFDKRLRFSVIDAAADTLSNSAFSGIEAVYLPPEPEPTHDPTPDYLRLVPPPLEEVSGQASMRGKRPAPTRDDGEDERKQNKKKKKVTTKKQQQRRQEEEEEEEEEDGDDGGQVGFGVLFEEQGDDGPVFEVTGKF